MQQSESSPSAVAAAVLEGGSPAQAELLKRLRAGDRAAFAELVDAWSPVRLRVALLHVSPGPPPRRSSRTRGWP